MRRADNLPPSCAVVMKSGNFKFLEPSGPLHACNGTDLPFIIYISLSIFLNLSITHYLISSWNAKKYNNLLSVTIDHFRSLPVPEAARSKAYVYGRSPAGVLGSNPTGDMDACLLWVLCVLSL